MLKNYFLIILFLSCACNSAQKIVSVPERWYDLLPHCPCRNPDFDSVRTHDGWARELINEEMRGIKKLVMGKRDFRTFHPGASACFRSYPPVSTIIGEKKRKSGQQCAYDEKGNLIKSGPAAGTPDKVSPAKGENRKGALRVRLCGVLGHQINDSGPWDEADWKKYHEYWPPDKGNGCGKNTY